jgi:hypothetical protein
MIILPRPSFRNATLHYISLLCTIRLSCDTMLYGGANLSVAPDVRGFPIKKRWALYILSGLAVRIYHDPFSKAVSEMTCAINSSLKIGIR